jgi:hypothetical protein
MKRVALSLLSASLIALAIPRLIAQVPDQATHARSAGAQTRIISIAVPPLPNAPFTATVSTEWIRTLEDGGTLTLKNHRTIARDNNGRVFEERRYLLPPGDARDTVIRQLEIADPRTHTIYYCQPDAHACEIQNYYRTAAPPPLTPAGPLDGGKRFLTRVDLGRDTVNGAEVVGTRETLTINPGAVGNDRAISVVNEFWYSPQLGINVVEKRQDPQDGAMTFIVDQITLGEPDARFFELPSGFHIDDTRKTAPAQSTGSN